LPPDFSVPPRIPIRQPSAIDRHAPLVIKRKNIIYRDNAKRPIRHPAIIHAKRALSSFFLRVYFPQNNEEAI
jgi:hypothetical protein